LLYAGPAWTEILLFVLPPVAGITVPSHQCRWGLMNFLQALALNQDTPDFWLPSTQV
jgi:hypothetical protein